MRGSIWIGFAFLLALVAISLFILFPSYQPLAVSGQYAIETVRYTYTDDQRTEPYSHTGENRRVNLVCWYPGKAGSDATFPLVIFSHGGLGTENSNESLFRELASHGYVVCSIGHPFHAFWTKSEKGRTTFVNLNYFGEIQREDASTNKLQSLGYYRKWLEIRTADINFVMDTILAHAAENEGGVYTRVDGARIGLMGHSLGGSAVLAIPRQRDDVDAVIVLESPYLYDIVGMEDDKFIWLDEEYPVPALNIYSDSSWNHLSEWPQYARNAELLSSAPKAGLSLYFPGRGHFSLTDLSLASPLLTKALEGGQTKCDAAEYLQDVNHACLEFFDSYLKNAE